MKSKDVVKMSKSQMELLTLTPLADYEVPDFATCKDYKPNITRKKPVRWKSKVMTATAFSLLGMMTLTGCSMSEQFINAVNDSSFDPWDYATHHGGVIGTPIYVAYLTEQDALEIIRTQLEAVGLNFNSIPPTYTITYGEGFREREIGLDLLDEEAGVAIALIDDGMIRENAENAAEFAQGATNKFNDHYDLLIRVFTNREIWWDIWNYNENDFYQGREEVYEELYSELDEQIQDFIEQLQEKGIIE